MTFDEIADNIYIIKYNIEQVKSGKTTEWDLDKLQKDLEYFLQLQEKMDEAYFTAS